MKLENKKEELNLEIIGNKIRFQQPKIFNNEKAQPRYFLERKILTKNYNALAELPLNNSNEEKFFVSKTKRIGKYNPNNKITKKELIIYTRNELIQTKKNSSYESSKKPGYIEYRHKKYSSYEKSLNNINQKIIKLKPYSTEYMNVNSNLKNNKNDFFQNFNYSSNNSSKITKSLYSILSMRKNQFMDAYNEAKEKEKKNNYQKNKQKQFIMDKTPMANFYSRKKEIKTYISSSNVPLSYISVLNDGNYLISEKLRFQDMMEKLSKLKLCIEGNPKKEYSIIKEFLMRNKIFEVDNFQIHKLKNFLKFIKGDFLIDPSKNFKENILDVLNGKEMEKPQLSYDLIELSIKKNKSELTKEDIIESKSDNINNDNCIVKNIKRNPLPILINSTESNPIKESESLVKNKNKSNKKIKENNIQQIYPKTLTKSEIIERLLTKKYHEVEKVHNNQNNNFSEKEKLAIKNFKELPLNLRRQKEICISGDDNLDFVTKPKIIIDLLEKKFKEEEKENTDLRAKTVSNWKKIMKSKNEKLYGEKKNKSDYEELKKRNMLTEYICLMKAKNKLEINKLEEKYKL